MNLLDYVMKQAEKSSLPRKSTLRDVMAMNTDSENEELWEKIYAAGGYEALED